MVRRLRPSLLVAAIAALTVLNGCAGYGARTGVADMVGADPTSAVVPHAVKPPMVTQLITVTATSHTTTYARLVAYHWSHQHWVKAFGPWTARIGYNGIAKLGAKREGDGKTPSGRYGFGFFFGVLRNPGVAFSYRQARSYDVWDDDPSSPNYNEWIDKRYRNPGQNPEPMDNQPAYNYGAVIAYNTKRVPGLGSAIFLHVGTGQSTAGCVSLPQKELLDVLAWMRPADHPQIVISVRR
jgi:L,D-peptidoglycan transpeptidase YkuD (ErfK/YbiS/YcfS/YnhG family)